MSPILDHHAFRYPRVSCAVTGTQTLNLEAIDRSTEEAGTPVTRVPQHQGSGTSNDEENGTLGRPTNRSKKQPDDSCTQHYGRPPFAQL